MSMVSTPETLMDLIRSSLEGGVPAEDLVEVVRRTDAEVHHREGVSGLSAEGQALPTYYSKPDRLVGIDEAAEMADVSRGTIGRWLREGRVERAGILHRQFGPGNRNLTLLNRADLERELGRSKDGLLVFQSKRAGHVTIDEAAEVAQVSRGTIGRWLREGRVRRVGVLLRRSGSGIRQLTLLDRREVASQLDCSPIRGLPLYTEAPPQMVTIADAARQTGVAEATVRSWLRKGRILPAGYLRCEIAGGYRNVTLVHRGALDKHVRTPDPRLPEYREVPECGILIAEAAKLAGVTQATVRSWLKAGAVGRVGYLRSRSTGGPRHLTLLDRAAVTRRVNSHPRAAQPAGGTVK